MENGEWEAAQAVQKPYLTKTDEVDDAIICIPTSVFSMEGTGLQFFAFFTPQAVSQPVPPPGMLTQESSLIIAD